MLIPDSIVLAFLTSAVAALAFYMVYGAGQMNISQAGFMAVGAYAAALSMRSEQFPLWLGLIIGLAVATVLSLALAVVTAKLGGVYLAVATLAFVVVVQQVIIVNPSIGGAVGLPGIPRLLGVREAAIVTLVVVLFVRRLVGSRLGFEMRTAREDVVTARAIGINLRSLRLRTAVVSAWLAAIAGAMEALSTSFVGPSDFGFSALIAILAIAVVGGTDRWWGPVLGAIVITVLPEVTRFAAGWREILTGILILGVILLFPEGLVGAVLRVNRWWRRFFGRSRPEMPIREEPNDPLMGVEDSRGAAP